MSSRLRIHVLLVIVVCVVGAGVASSAIQRSASNADFTEFQGVTALRGAMLAQQTALQDTIQQHTQGDPELQHRICGHIPACARSVEQYSAARLDSAPFHAAPRPYDDSDALRAGQLRCYLQRQLVQEQGSVQ